jgi:hypothetical protein
VLRLHVRFVPEADIRPASQSLESGVICRPGTLGVLGRGCPLARGRTRVKELAGKTAFVTGAASGIGPGYIRTQIMNSRRNLPKRFEGAVRALPTSGPFAEHINMVQERISQGIDPIYAGELVREGVERDRPSIFTDLEFEPMIEARFAAIKQGFDHIRGRNPKR